MACPTMGVTSGGYQWGIWPEAAEFGQFPASPCGVPTENLIRGGADPAMGYLRVGMLDLLKLLGGFLAGLFRSQAAREAEMAFLRQQLLVLKRSAPARLRLRTTDRVSAQPGFAASFDHAVTG